MMIPGSGDRSRRSTVTFQVAAKAVASYFGSDSVISGQFNCLYLKMRLDDAAGTDSSSSVALALSRTRLVLQMCAIEVASVTTNVSLPGTSQSQPPRTSEQCCDVSVMSDPILVVAANRTVPATEALFVNSTSQ